MDGNADDARARGGVDGVEMEAQLACGEDGSRLRGKAP